MKGRGRVIGVGIAGLGHVGGETARLLLSQAGKFSAALGARLALVRVADRRAELKARRLGLPARVRRSTDHADLLKDPAVDIVVELFGGLSPAKALVLAALGSGRPVVTANKHLVSRHWRELAAASGRFGRAVRFEAAVAGGIPIIGSLRTGLAANRIRSVSGIFNGTTNYILSKMAHDFCGPAEALAEAQRLGMAEADPTLDLNGTDTAHKVSILASMLSGRWLPPRRIPRAGIEGVGADDMRFAIEMLGHTVRLIGTVRLPAGPRSAIEAHVQPTLIPVDHPLAAVHGGYNAVLVDAAPAGDLMYYGLGAGPGPAASSVLADILALARDILRGAPASPAIAVGSPAAAAPESPAPYYLKLLVRDVPGALSSITGVLGRLGISIASIHQSGRSEIGGKPVPVMIITHETERRRVDRARRELSRLKPVSREHSCLRFLPG